MRSPQQPQLLGYGSQIKLAFPSDSYNFVDISKFCGMAGSGQDRGELLDYKRRKI